MALTKSVSGSEAQAMQKVRKQIRLVCEEIQEARQTQAKDAARRYAEHRNQGLPREEEIA